jgi:hypothetical protein
MTETESYGAARTRAGWLDRSQRDRFTVSGPDRARLLHNLTTNDIQGLPIGRGCEAFVTSPQGKTLGLVTVHAGPDQILLRADPGALETIRPHLEKYGVLEDAQLQDIGPETREIHLLGPRSGEILGALGISVPADSPELAVITAAWRDASLLVIRESPAGVPGWTLIGPLGVSEALLEAIGAVADAFPAVPVPPEVFEALRIEAGTPVQGRDVTPENLPQELDRNDRAISFHKGCYLGQETVARLDALGHVNKILRGLRVRSDTVPDAGSSLVDRSGHTVGKITSVAYSPGWRGPVALGLVRVKHAQAATQLALESNPAILVLVSELPMIPPSPIA